MKPIIDVLLKISAHLPSPVLPPVVPPLPALGVVPQLASIMGADPTVVVDSLQEHQRQRQELSSIVQEALPVIGAAVADLISEGEALMVRATPYLPGLLSLNPATVAASLAGLCLLAQQAWSMVEARLHRLEHELSPFVERALALVHSPAPEPPPLSPFSAQPEPPPAPDSSQPRDLAHPRPSSSSGSYGSASIGAAAAQAALSQVGTPYVWGGTGNGGFDCSGLTQWAYRQAGVELPRLAEEQNVGVQVTADQLREGDLAVWDGHVAMYAGNGMLVEAGTPVQTNPLRTSNMGMAFKGFWRPTG